jgi:hypothetical protein
MKALNKKTLCGILFLSIISISNISCAKEEDNIDQAITSAANISTDDTDSSITNPLQHGEEAHKNHCYKCHTDDMYTRENRFVKSIDALSQQVVRCKDSSDVPWFDEDADAVVQFLNKKYYKF